MPGGFIERLARVAAESPDAEAVVEHGHGALCFAELFARVERLGSVLIERGAGPEQVIALAIGKSTEYIVGMLACWYAGAAFVPLDPSLPQLRRSEYLASVKAPLVLSAGALPEPLASGATAVRTSASAGRILPPAQHDPERLAYVIFTSGSSGVPKGVEVTHRALVPMLDAQVARFQLGPCERSLWLLSTGFDASISDVGTALLSGAVLHIQPHSHTETPHALFETIKRLAISYVDLPPALLPHLPTTKPDCLKTLVVGGEAGSASAMRYWASRLRLVNVYGPTEATVCTSATLCTPDWERPLLGAELPGVRYEVVAEDGSSCEDDDPGELYISGACLARGYLNAPQLSEDRFVMRDGLRAFRTGDRVVRRRGGELEFLGRIDRQIKVRGALVAPEEIEARLLELPGVTRAAVLRGGPRAALTAFVVGEPGEVASMRAQLASRLPAFMVPERFVCLAELPTTDSGKPDFARLKEHGYHHQPRGAPPASRLEQHLAGCFAQVFGVIVGLDDDFFALGGDSLDLVEFLALACQHGIELTPSLVVGNPTVGRLANAIRSSDVRYGMAAHEIQARVDIEIRAAAPFLARNPGIREDDAVLVTGATGFLGAHIVRELLMTTQSQILCLVRASGERAALARVLQSLQAQNLSDIGGAHSRLVPVPGDLERLHFGLREDEFADLSGRVHTVFHCGAQVSLMADCDSLWSANVGGTREVMRLVASGRAKALHYVSTLAVFVSADEGHGTFFESDQLEGTTVVFGGYAQTKWAAEVLVRTLADHGGGTYIHRLGLLTGSSEKGGASPNDWLALTVRGLARLGAIPSELDPDLAMDVTPVDYAARAIVAIASRAQAGPAVHTTHLAGSRAARFVELVSAMRSAGVELKTGESSAFLATIQEGLVSRTDHELAAACLALRRACIGVGPQRELDLFQATRCRFDDRHARRLLEGSGIECPPVTVELLIRYVRNILKLDETPNARC